MHGIGYLDPPPRIGRDLVGDDGIAVRERMRHEIIVGHLQKRIHSCRLVELRRRPGADGAKCWDDRFVRPDEEPGAALLGPIGKFVAARLDLVADFLDAENLACRVAVDQPLPERRTEIQPAMKVFCLNEDISIKQVWHQTMPRLCPSSRNVASFEKPSRRKASRYRVCPSSVLITSARAKRLPTRAPCVR